MKQCLAKIACGFAAASLALALAACDDSSSASNATGPESEEEISSESNGGDNPELSSDSGNGSENIESSETTENPSDETSSTSKDGNSSASKDGSSSSVENCVHITDNKCRITQGCALTPCMSGTRVIDCARNLEYICNGGSWEPAAESSSSVQSNTPKYSDNCANISGGAGNDKWNCNEEDFTLAKDCNDSASTYMCVSKRWFKTDDCNSAKPNCGYDDYTICLKTKLREYCSKDGWLDEPCNYGEDPIRWLFIYDKPDDLGYDREERYSCNQNGKWEKIVNNCDSGMDCGNNKSDDKGILPDGAPCQNVGEQMTVEGYNYQCINNVWTRL